MKNKSLSLGVMSVLAMLLVVSFASAAITLTGFTNVDPYANSFTVQVNGLIGDSATVDVNDIIVNGNTLVDFESTITILPMTATTGILTIDYTAYPTYFQYEKTYNSIIELDKGLPTAVNYTVSTIAKDFCENCSNAGGLTMTVENVKVISGFGDDDNYWYPMDEVEIELKIENDGNWDIKSIDVDWALYTTDGNKIADDDLSTFKLKEGDDKTLTLTIKLDEDISDFESQDVVLYAKAKGTISDSNAGTHDNKETCDSDSVQVQMITDDNFVILDNFELSGVALEELTLENYSVICGEEIEFVADVWNIQADDEQDVSVNIYNKELGINQKIEIGDVDAFDKEALNIKVKLPSKIENKWYSLLFEVLDEDGDVFENSEDGVSSYNVKFKVEGCNVKVAPIISAELGSEAKAGEDLTIKTVITNPGNNEAVYIVKISNYTDWGVLKTSENTEITLKSGESKEVEITFGTNRKSVGDKTFNLEILSGNEVVAKQPVAVTIAKNTTEVKDFVTKNWKLIGIILLNLILVIAIITVIVKIYRR